MYSAHACLDRQKGLSGYCTSAYLQSVGPCRIRPCGGVRLRHPLEDKPMTSKQSESRWSIPFLTTCVLVCMLVSACSPADPVLGEDEPGSVGESIAYTVYSSSIADLGRTTDYVKSMYTSRDPGVDFVSLTAKYMSAKEYAEHVVTDLVAEGHTYEDYTGATDAEKLVIVVGFKTHSRVELLGVHRLSPNDEAASSPDGYLSPVDGMMGVIHALDAHNGTSHGTVMYTSGTTPDYLEQLISYQPAPIVTPTSPVPIVPTPTP